MDDPLYFRQLLAGRDFARGDQVARQMVNFVYLVGDRRTGEAVVVDPAYDIAGLLDVVAADGMHLVGALATHYHPDHVGGTMGGFSIQGVRELLELAPVPVHVQADEAPWVTRVTDAGDDDLVTHASGDVVMVGQVPDRAASTRPVTRRAASASWSTTTWWPVTRSSSRAAGAPTCRAATRPSCTRA